MVTALAGCHFHPSISILHPPPFLSSNPKVRATVQTNVHTATALRSATPSPHTISATSPKLHKPVFNLFDPSKPTHTHPPSTTTQKQRQNQQQHINRYVLFSSWHLKSSCTSSLYPFDRSLFTFRFVWTHSFTSIHCRSVQSVPSFPPSLISCLSL
jgi:hypothetical protein